MSRPRTPNEVVKRIEDMWAEDPDQSATRVHRKYRQSPRQEDISLRSVQYIIRKLKHKTERDGGVHFTPETWKPWANKDASAEDIAYLLKLDSVCVVKFLRHLYEHEADWARRLRVVLSDPEISFNMQLLFVREYGVRETIARNTGQLIPTTNDLDAQLSFKPWTDKHHRREIYDKAVREDLVSGHYGIVGGMDVIYDAAAQELREREPYYFDPWNTVLEWLDLPIVVPFSVSKVIDTYSPIDWMFFRLFEILGRTESVY